MTNLVGALEAAAIRQAYLDNTFDMTAVVERDMALMPELDEYDHVTNWQVVGQVPCHWWVQTGAQLFAREMPTANVEMVIRDARLLAPWDADITEEDIITSVRHLGVEQLVTPLAVRGVERWSFYLKLSVREVA